VHSTGEKKIAGEKNPACKTQPLQHGEGKACPRRLKGGKKTAEIITNLAACTPSKKPLKGRQEFPAYS